MLDINKDGSEPRTPSVKGVSPLPPIDDDPTTPAARPKKPSFAEPSQESTSGVVQGSDLLENDLASALSSTLFSTPEKSSRSLSGASSPTDDDFEVARYASLLKTLSSPSRQPTDPFDNLGLKAPKTGPVDDSDKEAKRADSVFAKLEGLHPQSGIPNVPVVTAKVPGAPKLDIEGWRAARDNDPDSWCCEWPVKTLCRALVYNPTWRAQVYAMPMPRSSAFPTPAMEICTAINALQRVIPSSIPR
ncbi:hypothetical protein FRC08_009136 [Ceratobasidium sp. 394]|nr:hypothetical protein FRC08_009136 [Ceratobasidium sp. 394]